MPFGNDAGPSIVYSYYARKPRMGAEIVNTQFSLMHKYKNTLIALELEKRNQYNLLLQSFNCDIGNIENEILEISNKIKTSQETIKKRNAFNKKRTAKAEEREQISMLKEQRRILYQKLHEIKQQIKTVPKIQEAIQKLNAGYSEKQKELRKNSKLYWGNYLSVEGDIPKTGKPPKFKSWNNNGKVCCQIQHGLSIDAAFSCTDSRLRIIKPPDSAYMHNGKPTSEQKRQMRTTAYVRIGTDEFRKPVFAEVPILLHRLPPEDAKIKWVYLIKRIVAATSEEWKVQFVLEREAGWDSMDCAKSGVVEVKLGWKLTPNGFSIATVKDSISIRDYLLDRAVLDMWQKSESIGALRKNSFNQYKEQFQTWLNKKSDIIPKWISEATEYINKWDSASRFGHLLRIWRDNQFQKGKQAFQELEIWNKDDLHLKRWECASREKAINIRNELYKQFAAQLRRQYRTIRISSWDIQKMTKKPKAEENKNVEAVRKYLRIAAPGFLRQCIVAKAKIIERLGDEEKVCGARSIEESVR